MPALLFSPSLRERAAVLAPAAEQFVREQLRCEVANLAGGSEGLLALCRAMERWVYGDEDVPEESERRFVEGAGALLGLLLIDHVGDATHEARAATHRIRLGRHGYVDPFAAIDRALDAEDVRAELAHQVALAEAEAQGRGPVSRVVAALLAAMARERPDLAFDAQFDATLWVRARDLGERLEIDLRRAVETTRDQDDAAVARVVERLLSLLPGAKAAPIARSELEARMLPRLARTESLRELEGKTRGALFALPLTEELSIALLLEYEGRARYVYREELAAAELDGEAALACARRNLAERSARFRVVPLSTECGALLVARTGDGLDSARVLLATLYDELAARLGERVVVGIPHRDTFYACNGDPSLCEELARRAAHDAERAPHRLSGRLFELTPAGLRDLR